METDLQRERHDEEFGLSHREQPVLEPFPRPPERQISPRAPDDQPAVTHGKGADRAQAAVAKPTEDPFPASRQEGQPETSTPDDSGNPPCQGLLAGPTPPIPVGASPPPPALVEISFWALERDDEWSKWILPTHHRWNVLRGSIHGRTIRYMIGICSLSPAQCYRAATVDGNNAILLISEHEEKRLVAEGRLVKDRQLLSSVSRVLHRAEPSQKSAVTRVLFLRHLPSCKRLPRSGLGICGSIYEAQTTMNHVALRETSQSR